MEVNQYLKKINISKSDIEYVIKNEYYVDKTRYIQELILSEEAVFIIRPRRFGKSLFIETIAAVAEGKEELFKNCYIGKSGYVFKKYPIIHLDFSGSIDETPESFREFIIDKLERIAIKYNVTIKNSTVQRALSTLIYSLVDLYKNSTNEKTNSNIESKIVVLIDEYDSPVRNEKWKSEQYEKKISILKCFFEVLKSLNNYLKLTFVSGINKCALTDIRSGANHLQDITLDENVDAMFGFTEKEIETFLNPFIQETISMKSKEEEQEKTYSDIINDMKFYYNGYRFSSSKTTVFNPISVLNYLKTGKLENYWIESGTSSYFISEVENSPERFTQAFFDLTARRHELLFSLEDDKLNFICLLFQLGYLTITDYDRKSLKYTLGYPNEEVISNFEKKIHDTIGLIFKQRGTEKTGSFSFALENKDIDHFIYLMKSCLKINPYNLIKRCECEYFYHTCCNMILAGAFKESVEIADIKPEESSSKGICDLVLTLKSVICLIEIKYNKTAIEALEQIRKKDYHGKYESENKEIILLGINFGKEERNINDYKYEIIEKRKKFKKS